MKTRLMRRFAGIGLGVCMAAGLFAVPGTSSAELVDLTVDIASIPETVAPAGAGVVYRITASNVGVLPLLPVGGVATITGSLPAGFTVIDSGSCTVAALTSTYTCAVTTLPQSFDISMRTLSTPSTYTRTASATITSVALTEPLEYTGNNTDTATTYVQPLDPELGSASFVCGGCSLTFSDPDVGSATVTIPAEQHSDPSDPSSPMEPVIGVFVYLHQDDEFTGEPCGDPSDGYVCRPALEVAFDDAEVTYQADDPYHPVVVRFTPKQDPCAGMADQCAPLGYWKPGMEDQPPEAMPDCDGAGAGVNAGTGEAFVDGEYHLCRDHSFKANNKVGHAILMISTDPTLPPLGVPRIG